MTIIDIGMLFVQFRWIYSPNKHSNWEKENIERVYSRRKSLFPANITRHIELNELLSFAVTNPMRYEENFVYNLFFFE